MHAVCVTFHSSAPLDDLRDPFVEAAGAIRDVPGLLSKTWLQAGERVGGFYIFTDADAARAYLDGQIVADTMAVEAFSDWDVQQFTVLEDLSAITRGVPARTLGTAD